MLCKCKLGILSRNMAHNTKKTDSGKVPDTQVMASGLAVVFFRAASQHRNDAPKLNAADNKCPLKKIIQHSTGVLG